MKKTLLLTTTLLLSVSPIALAVSCGESDPAIQTWSALDDGFLNVTMEDVYMPYNFSMSAGIYNKILEQSKSIKDLTADDGMTPLDARDWIEMILPIDSSSPEYNSATPYIGGIDPYMAKQMAKRMSTTDKPITPKIYVQNWEKIKAGWFYDKDATYEDDEGVEHLTWPKGDDSNMYDMVISAMAPDDDKKPRHTFTNEYLLTENVIAQFTDKPKLNAKIIRDWKITRDEDKVFYGKIAVENFPASDPNGDNNIAVKYFGKQWVEQRGDLEGVMLALSRSDNNYAFIEDIQGEEMKLKHKGAYDYTKDLFPLEPKVKSAMSVKPGTPKFVLNHINNYLKDEANDIEQNWLKTSSIKMSAYCNK